MLLVGVVPLLIGLLMAFLQGTREIRQVSGVSFAGLAGETARKLDLVLSDELAATLHLTTDQRIIEALEQRRDAPLPEAEVAVQLEQAALAWTAKHPAAVEAVLKGPVAEILQQFYTGAYTDPGHPLPLVTRSATRALFVTDVRGALVGSIHDNVEYLHADTQWWQRSFHKGVGQPHIESVTWDEREATYTFSITLPVMDRLRYQAIGVLHRVYDAKEFFAPSVFPIRFGETGHAMLIDGNGTVLSCPILPTGSRLADSSLILQVTQEGPGWVSADSDGHGGQGTSIIGFAALPGTSRITRQSSDLAWHTFVWQSSEELFAPVRHLLTWISVFGVVAVALLVTLGFIAAGRIVSPIRKLQEAARLIGQGQLRDPIEITTRDEIEDLAVEINRMNVQLEAAFAGLTDQVAEKTREVQYLQRYTDEILDSIPAPVLIVDQDERVQYVNRPCQEAFGVAPTSETPVELFTLLATDEPGQTKLRGELASFAMLAEDPAADGEATGSRSPLPRPKDPLAPTRTPSTATDRREIQIGTRTYRYEWFRTTPRAGEPPRVGLVLRDATDESRLQDRLIHAEKLASLGVLSAGIGHELNNPLFGVLGLGEAIQDESDLKQVKSYAQDIVRHGKRMVAIIQDLTGTIAAQSDQRPVPTDVNAELEHALKLALHATIHDGSLRLTKTLGTFAPITANPDDVRQIFLNVLTNAVQAMKNGGDLTVTTQLHEGTIRVLIEDTGPGIPRAYLPRIFDPFFTTKAQGEGSGLGLTTARRLVMKYGGQISLTSEEGRGTSCLITFPVTARVTNTTRAKTSA